MENTTAIQLVQSPVIKHALQEVGKSVTDRLAELNIENLIATDDTVKGLKKLSAELTKELKEYEEQRKVIKNGVMNPYNEFEGIYKSEISEKYKKAIDTLKAKVSAVEDNIKESKKKEVEIYFNSLCASHEIDFVKFEKLGIDINLSTTVKKYKEQVDAYIAGILSDLQLIDTQEHKTETLVEYKKVLSVSEAIITVKNRKAAEEEEAAKIAKPAAQEAPKTEATTPVEKTFVASPGPEPEPEIVPPPATVQGEKIVVASIRISGTAAQLKAVGEFLRANKIEYTNI